MALTNLYPCRCPRALAAEDRVPVGFQVLFLVVAGVLAMRAAMLLWKRGEPLTALLWMVFALGCVAIFGEEVAWGQRLVQDFATPETVKDVNTQASTTVHNLQGAGIKAIDLFNACFLLVGIYGSVGAALIRWPAGSAGLDWSTCSCRRSTSPRCSSSSWPTRRPGPHSSGPRDARTSPTASTSNSGSPSRWPLSPGRWYAG